MSSDSIGRYRHVPSYYPFSVAAIILLGLALRVSDLTESLWFDELWSTKVMLGSLSQLFTRAMNDLHPPGYLVLNFVWIRLFGDSELSVRTIPLLSGLCGIGLTCEIARRWASPPVGLLAGTLVALSPVHIWYSQEARPYALLSASILLAVWARSFLIRENAASWWFGWYAVSMGTALSLHHYALAFAGVYIGVDLVARDPARRRLLLANAAGCAAIFGYVGWRYAMDSLRTSTGYLSPFRARQLWMTLFDWFPTGNALQLEDLLMLGSHLLVASLLLWGGISAWRSWRVDRLRPNPLELFIPFVCVPMLLCGLAMLGFDKIFIERSLFVSLPFFFILVAAGLGTARPAALRVVAGVALFVLMGSGLVAFFQKSDEWTVYKRNPNWRTAAAFILDDVEDGRGMIFVATPADVLLYYSSEFRRVYASSNHERPPRLDIYRFRQGGAWIDVHEEAPYDYAYLIHNRFWPAHYDRKSKRFRSDHRLELVSRHDVKGLSIEKYRIVEARGDSAVDGMDSSRD
jgi:mannosyltransferase